VSDLARGSDPVRSRGLVLACITAATFTDLVAYSIAVPVLPDYAARFQASPTVIGFLFASFGVTLLAFSIPMGAISDRIGRKGPMMGALALLTGSTLLFAYSDSLWLLFTARMLQGAADAVAWVVGFALIADLYGPHERGRAMGLVMAGSSFGVILGPFLGGWLYERGGIRLPFLFVAALALLELIVFAGVAPRSRGMGSSVSLRKVMGQRSIVICAIAVIAGSATFGMLEPVVPLWLQTEFRLRPGAIGTVFGAAALASTLMHPVYGQLSDRWGGWRLMMTGLTLSALILPILSLATGSRTAAITMVPLWAVLGLIVTPSLAFMAQATAAAGLEAYGVVYGVYNVAWAVGLMSGPALGGFLFERIGFDALVIGWGMMLLTLGAILTRLAPGQSTVDSRQS